MPRPRLVPTFFPAAMPSRALLLLLLFILLPGCAQNVVHLVYPAPKESVAAKADAPSVCVVTFEDRRDKAELGLRRDGDKFQPRTNIADWMSRAMADELAQTGLTVTYADNLAQARASNPGYIVTGIIDEVWLTENSLTRYTSTMRVTLSVLHANGSYLTKTNYNSSFSQTVLPTSDAPQSTLSEGLVDLLRPAAQNIERSLK